jgi:chromosome segregation ATPase
MVASTAKEVVMGRAKEEPRGRLATLQDMLAGGGKALVDQALDQAQTVRDGVQRLVDLGRGVEEQFGGLIAGIEERLSTRVDDWLSNLAVSLRRDVERQRERLRAVEARLADVPREGVRELIAPLQAVAGGAAERASSAVARAEELGARLQHLERRIAELSRESARETLDGDDFRQRMERIEQRLTDLGREVGTKLGEVGALRERLTRMEGRVVDTSKDQIARAGETAGLRDRLTRLEGRLSDLSKEQLARAVETAALRERLFRLEQRGAAAPFEEPIRAGVAVED